MTTLDSVKKVEEQLKLLKQAQQRVLAEQHRADMAIQTALRHLSKGLPPFFLPPVLHPRRP